jgi:hypothetical protein
MWPRLLHELGSLTYHREFTCPFESTFLTKTRPEAATRCYVDRTEPGSSYSLSRQLNQGGLAGRPSIVQTQISSYNPHTDRYSKTVFLSLFCSLLNSESLAAA